MTRLWHPYSDMGAVRGHELVIDRAEGVWLWDADGHRYLDATSSLWYANVGHGREEIVAAVAAQMRRLDAYSIFGDLSNAPAEALAERLATLAPMDDPRVFLTSGGGDSIDSAAKIARRYWAALGLPQRTHLIGRTGGFHGTHGFGTSVGGIETNRADFGPLMGATSVVAHDDLRALEQEFLRVGPDNVAAFFVEPVIGAGGVLHPPEGYLEGVAQLCEGYGVLLVVDAVICAFGRLGTWFGIERWGVSPDMIAFAKGVTSGYLPLGGVVASGRVAAPFWEQEGVFLRHGATYAGHPAGCAAALANLDLIERDGLLDRARELEGELASALAGVAGHPLVSELRAGVGVLAALEIDADALAGGVTVAQAAMAIRRHGILVRPLGSSIAVSPPLTIERELLDEIAGGIRAGLDDVAAR